MKLKNILIITIAIVTLGLVVACSDDVVVTNKDNNQDYTQVLTSNGAFEYNGTKYDTLQLALKAIVDGKGDIPDVKTIKVLRDVTGPGASISAEKTIVLDLDGHTLTFIDVEKEALTAGGSVNLTVKNGTLALEDKNNSDLAVVYAKDATALTFNGVVINAAGQNALVSTGTNSVTIDNGSAITGNTTATGGNYFTVGNNVTPDNSSLSGVTTVSVGHFYAEEGSSVAGILVAKDNSNVLVLNIMEAGIYLESGADLTVDGEGHATLKSIEEGCVVIAKDESAITNETGSDIDVQTGTSYILRDGVKTYYGDLKAALDSLDKADREIVLIRSENNVFSSALKPNNDYSVIINLGSFSIEPTGENKTNLTSTGKITLVANTNASKIDGSVQAAALDVTNVEVTGAVTVTGALTSKGSVFKDAVSAASLIDGEGEGTTEAPYQNGSTFNGQITVEGTATFMASTINNGASTVYAKEVTIYKSIVTTTGIGNGTETEGTYTWYKPSDSITIDEGSTITVSGLVGKAVTIEDTSINAAVAQGVVICGKLRIEDNTPITQPSDVVLITNSIGSIYLIDAGTTSTGEYNAVTVSNGSATGILTISTITATGYDVALTGQSADKLIVGVVTSANLIADYTTFNGNITATGAGSFTNSVFTPGSAANRALEANTVSITGSSFNTYVAELASYVFNITADKTDATVTTTTSAENLKITSSIGTAGSVTTTGNTANYKSIIVIDNSALTTAGTHTLSVGAVSAYDGSETPVAFGNVTIKGYFSDVDGTENDVDSRVTVARIDYAYDVTTSWAVVSGNVSCNTDKHVNTLISENSEFDGTVYAGSVTDGKATPSNDPTPTYTYSDGSTFKGGIQTTGLIELRTSVLHPSANESVEKFVYSESPDVVEEEVKTAAITMRGVTFSYTGAVYAGVWADKGGSISMTNSKGKAFKIVATDNSGNHTPGTVTIDNSALTEDTFNVKDNVWSVVEESSKEYFGDVTIKGHSAAGNLVVDRVFANDIKISYATVNTDVTAKTSPGSTDPGDITTEDSIFEHTVTASGSITDGAYTSPSAYSNGSTFNGAVSAVGVITLYNSTTTSSVSSTGEGGKVLAYKASLGDTTGDDYIHASVVSITDGSKMYLLGGIKGCGGAVPAASVTITNPVLYVDATVPEDDTPSRIGSISTGSLSVTAGDDKLTVTSATATGEATISGGTFTGTVSLSGTTSISGGVFSGTNSLSGTSTINDGNLSGPTTFTDGTATINGGSFGSENAKITQFGTNSMVYVNNCTTMHIADSNSGNSEFKSGSVVVYGRGGLEYVGSHILQTANTQHLTITTPNETGHVFSLDNDAYINSAFLNLSLVFNVNGEDNSVWIASSTGNLAAYGYYNNSSGAGLLKYHVALNPNVVSTVKSATY